MGRRGPKPTPTTVLRLAGSRKVSGRKGEVKPPAGKVTPPDWLTDDALKAWKYFAPILESMKLLSTADWLALARYCEAYSTWLACKTWIEVNGRCYPLKNKAGNVAAIYPWPEVAMMQNAQEYMRKAEAEFGLTPSARVGLQVMAPTADTQDDRFFAG